MVGWINRVMYILAYALTFVSTYMQTPAKNIFGTFVYMLCNVSILYIVTVYSYMLRHVIIIKNICTAYVTKYAPHHHMQYCAYFEIIISLYF